MRSFRPLAIGVLAMAVVVALTAKPVRESFVGFLDWTAGLGAWGPIVLAAAWVPACLFFLPGSLLSLGSGFILGVPAGIASVSVGSVAGATSAFLAGRTLARDWVARRAMRDERFAAIDRAVGREGFKIVFLLRLSPAIPFNLLNYALGLTKVRLRDYVLASWIGMAPGTVMYVWLGSALSSLAEVAAGRVQGGAAGRILFFLGLAATALVTVYVTRLARRTLAETIDTKTTGVP